VEAKELNVTSMKKRLKSNGNKEEEAGALETEINKIAKNINFQMRNLVALFQ